MSPLTKRMIMIGLWIPFAAYAAREWTGTVGRSAGSMPVSQKPDRDKAAKAKAEKKYKADVARDEVQASVSFTSVKNKSDYKEALTEREWAMKNAQPFFDGANFRDKPTFGGEHAMRFEPLFEQVKKLVDCEKEFEKWYKRDVKPPLASALRELDDDILKPFSDNKAPQDMSSKYSLRGRYRVLDEIAKQLAKDYDKRLSESKMLPVSRSDEILPKIEAVLKLHAECNGIDAPSVKLDTGRDEQDWKARLELLNLFAKNPVSLTPPESTEWFDDVNKYYGHLKDAATKRLIREKVQQFCGQYVPDRLALDEYILVDGKPMKREEMKVRYKADGKFLDLYRLSTDPKGLNERNAEKAPPDAPPGTLLNTYVRGANSYPPDDVKATPLSAAAFDYFKARQDVPGNGWNRKTMLLLFDKAGPAAPGSEHIWNNLSRLMVADLYKVYDRLKIVEEAIKTYTALFPE